MKRIKNCEIAARADGTVEQRFAAIHADIHQPKKQIRAESVEQYLARGGHITVMDEQGKAARIINFKPKSEPQPQKQVQKKEIKPMDKKMSAIDIAKQAADMTVDDVKNAIPVYAHPLPRRQWVRKFFDNLDPELADKFKDLYNLYKSQ